MFLYIHKHTHTHIHTYTHTHTDKQTNKQDTKQQRYFNTPRKELLRDLEYEHFIKQRQAMQLTSGCCSSCQEKCNHENKDLLHSRFWAILGLSKIRVRNSTQGPPDDASGQSRRSRDIVPSGKYGAGAWLCSLMELIPSFISKDAS
jgi:hypothetical protein